MVCNKTLQNADHYVLQIVNCYQYNIIEKPDCSYQLRSKDQGLLFIPKTRAKTLGNRAFAHAGPSTWNKLPDDIRNIKSIKNFKSQLKTFLFKKAYDSNFQI